MATSYRPQATQVNKEPPPYSFLNLTLTQHLHNEDPKPRKMHACLEVEPLQAWYYHIFLNSHTVAILLQVDLVSGDEPEIIYEGYYEIDDISIFAWSSILDVGHYRLLRSSIR
jgi:hypothetical protein